MPLTFIVLACHLNVSVPDENNKDCKIFKQEIYQGEDSQELNPMTCMMQSPPMLVKFEEEHPGWKARKWTCKYLTPEQDI